MDFRILGPLEVSDDDRPVPLGGARQRALLALLLLHVGEVVSSDRLIEGLWSGEPPREAANALQAAVSRLRRTLGSSERIRTRPPGYLLALAPGELDVERFVGLFAEGDQALGEGDPMTASARLRQALGLWRGPPLADFTYEPFVQTEIARLEELRLAALEARIEADLGLGQHAKLIGELEALIGLYPLREIRPAKPEP